MLFATAEEGGGRMRQNLSPTCWESIVVTSQHGNRLELTRIARSPDWKPMRDTSHTIETHPSSR